MKGFWKVAVVMGVTMALAVGIVAVLSTEAAWFATAGLVMCGMCAALLGD